MRILSALDSDKTGKNNTPSDLGYLEAVLITLVTNFVPSSPDSQGTFLNQGEIDAMPSVAPEISFKI